MNVVLQHNEAAQAGGVYNSGGILISNSKIIYNNASGTKGDVGPGLYNVGTAILANRTAVHGNRVPITLDPKGYRSLYNGGKVVYVMPVPLGHFMPAVFNCTYEMCQMAGTNTLKGCKVQSCIDSDGSFLSKYEGKPVAVLRQGVIDTEIPKQCAIGYYGDSYATQNQASTRCNQIPPTLPLVLAF